jgi:APA family basic amino acid/polyamine antiporter
VMLIVGGLSATGSSSFEVEKPIGKDGIPLALILILYAYGGWNDAAFVAATVRDRQRNIPRSLLFGITLISVCYLLVNAAYLATLGFEGLRSSFQPASDAMAKVFGATGKQAISVLVMVSALGSVNGLVFSVSRLHATVGADHPIFALLGRWSRRTQAPIWTMSAIGVPAIPWNDYYGTFETLFAASAPIFWLSFLTTGIAYFVLRWKDRNIERPFRAPLFPLCPALFCVMCAFGLYSSVMYARPLLPLISVPFLAGIPLYFVSEWMRRGQRL